MPNLKSAKKRLRQDAKKRLTNMVIKTRIKTETKRAVESGVLTPAMGVIDRAAAKGVIHKNTAARRKSRLARNANAAQAAKAAA